MEVLPLDRFLDLDIPDRGCIVDPIIPVQGLVMIYAARGVGKTHLAFGIAYAAALGRPFLRWDVPKPVDVLYVDGEMAAPKVQSRARKVATAYDSAPSSRFRIATPDLQKAGMPNLATQEGRDTLTGAMGPAKLVVLDNLSTLFRGTDENDAGSWEPTQEWLLQLRSAGRSVILVHHAGKGGQQRGSSKREDPLNTIIALRHPCDYKKAQGARFIVSFEKARDFYGEDAEPFVARFRADEKMATWEVEEVPEAEKPENEKLVEKLVKALGG